MQSDMKTRLQHWVALRSVKGQVFCLDSEEPKPCLMTDKQYHDFVQKHKSSFPIVWAEDMKRKRTEADTAPSSSSSSLDHSSPVLPIPESQEQGTLTSWPSDDTFDSPTPGLGRTGASPDIVMDG